MPVVGVVVRTHGQGDGDAVLIGDFHVHQVAGLVVGKIAHHAQVLVIEEESLVGVHLFAQQQAQGQGAALVYQHIHGLGHQRVPADLHHGRA